MNDPTIRVRTDKTRSGDDGQTVCTVLAGTEGTVVATKAGHHPLSPQGRERILLLTIIWDATLMNHEEASDGFVSDFWKELEVLQHDVKFVRVEEAQ
jgi:hypothetical protein